MSSKTSIHQFRNERIHACTFHGHTLCCLMVYALAIAARGRPFRVIPRHTKFRIASARSSGITGRPLIARFIAVRDNLLRYAYAPCQRPELKDLATLSPKRTRSYMHALLLHALFPYSSRTRECHPWTPFRARLRPVSSETLALERPGSQADR